MQQSAILNVCMFLSFLFIASIFLHMWNVQQRHKHRVQILLEFIQHLSEGNFDKIRGGNYDYGTSHA